MQRLNAKEVSTPMRGEQFIQGVSVNWIFSFRNKFVGLDVIFGPHQWWAGPGGS